jgi:hypothetical protein
LRRPFCELLITDEKKTISEEGKKIELLVFWIILVMVH